MSGIETIRGDTAAGADVPVAPVRASHFSPSRAVEYLLYIARRVDTPTIHELLKIRYFADKIHLSMFGMTASGDDYVAMRFGPVGSQTYDVLKAARGEKNGYIPAAFFTLVDGALKADGENVTPLRDPRLEKLSRADIECLDEAIKEYGNMNFLARTEISHDSAWKKGWKKAQESQSLRGQMQLTDIVQTLENADEVLEYVRL